MCLYREGSNTPQQRSSASIDIYPDPRAPPTLSYSITPSSDTPHVNEPLTYTFEVRARRGLPAASGCCLLCACASNDVAAGNTRCSVWLTLLQVTNTGGNPSPGTLSYTLPPGVDGASFTTTGGSCVLSPDKTTLDCNLGSLPPGGTVVVSFTGTPTAVSSGPPVSGSLTVTGTNPETGEVETLTDDTSGGITIVVRVKGMHGRGTCAQAPCGPPMLRACSAALAWWPQRKPRQHCCRRPAGRCSPRTRM